MAYLDEDGHVAFIPNPKQGGGSSLFPSTLEVAQNNKTYVFCYLKTFLDNQQIPFMSQKESFPYQISEDSGKMMLEAYDGCKWVYEDLMRQTFEEFKRYADNHLDEPVQETLIVVPAGMSEEAREKLLRVVEKSGFPKVSFLEADFAAIYSSRKINSDLKKRVVCDFSGGQFCVSVIQLENDGKLKRLAIESDRKIAADGVLSLILNWIFEKKPALRKPYLAKMSSDPSFFYHVFKNLEKVKQRLSHYQSVDIELLLPEKEEVFKIAFSNYEFSRILEGWFEQIESLCEKVLESVKIPKEDIEEIILVGGITRNPVVHAHFKKIFSSISFANLNSLQTVAEGAVYSQV